MDFPGDPVSLCQSRKLDLILLLFQKLLVFLFQMQRFLPGAVLGEMELCHHIFIFHGQPGQIQRQHPCEQKEEKCRQCEVMKMIQV